MSDFVFGYGSLIQTESRRLNLAAEAAPLPARLAGWRRSWNVCGPEAGVIGTFLGATEAAGGTINGVLAPVDSHEWPELDRREIGYRRVAIDPSSLDFLSADANLLPADSVVYLYVAEEPTPPTAAAPILQSYVDICLSGCLEIDAALGTGRAYAEEFLRTTYDWSTSWVNDRVLPRATLRTTPEAQEIDRLLQSALPTEFAAVRM